MKTRLTPELIARLTVDRLTRPEVIEVANAALNHTGSFQVAFNTFIAGRDVTADELAREMLRIARMCGATA